MKKILKKYYLKKKKLKIINFYSFDVFIAKAKDFFDEGIKGMKSNSDFFIKNGK